MQRSSRPYRQVALSRVELANGTKSRALSLPLPRAQIEEVWNGAWAWERRVERPSAA